MSKEKIKRGGSFLIEDTSSEEVFIPEEFSEEQKMFAQTAEEFMEKEVLPKSDDIEAQNFDILRQLMLKAGELGLLAVDIPEEYGGLGLDKVSSMLIAEKLGTQGSFSVTWGAHTGIGTLPIVFFGTKEQKEKYLPGLGTGELIGAYALTEPGAGSDALSIKTKAELSEDGSSYILNGSKIFITNAALADLFTLFAKVDGEKFTAFLIEKDTPGFSISPEEKKLGLKGSSTCGLALDNVKVPVSNLLGEIGKGHRIAFGILNIGRYKLGVGAVGASKRAIEESIRYAKERVQFGKPIAEFGLIQEKLARMIIRVFVTESMAYRLAGMLDQQLSQISHNDPDYAQKVWYAIAEYAVECSILKVYGSETLDLVADEMVQIYGGYGYIQEYPAEQVYRDSRINRIFEGTNEINRLLIPGMLMRRAMEGRIPLIPKAMEAVKSSITLLPSTLRVPEGDLGKERLALLLLKKATLLNAGVAADRFKESIREEQEVLAALADMVMEIFGLESIILRAMKTNNDLMKEIACLYAFEAAKKIEKLSQETLPYMLTGDELKTLLGAVRKLIRPIEPPPKITIQHKVTRSALDKGKYPFNVV